jgi:hypothetical protein
MTGPRLTVRAFAELLALPAYAQLRILQEQKYPRNEPQTFKLPYYAPALTAIREYYRADNDARALATARQDIASIKLASKRDNNLRVLHQFEGSKEAVRQLKPHSLFTKTATIGNTVLSLRFDLVASEAGKPRLVFYNCRQSAMDGEIARITLELAHWVLEQQGGTADLKRLQLVDLPSTARAHSYATRRPTTMRKAQQTARVIEALWDTI